MNRKCRRRRVRVPPMLPAPMMPDFMFLLYRTVKDSLHQCGPSVAVGLTKAKEYLRLLCVLLLIEPEIDQSYTVSSGQYRLERCAHRLRARKSSRLTSSHRYGHSRKSSSAKHQDSWTCACD